MDPNTGVFDKWRLYKTHSFVHVGNNLTILNQERNVCLAAQTSLDRLYSLTETLEHWSGPVSIGKYEGDNLWIIQHFTNIKMGFKSFKLNIFF